MAQSYKKGRKFKTESPALLSITRGGRPAAAPRPLPSAFRLCAPATIPASVPPSAFRLWIVVGVRFLRRGKRGRAVPDKIGVVEILLKNRAPRGWNPANNS